MKSSRSEDPIGSRHFKLIVALTESAIWFNYLWIAVRDSDHMTQILQRDFAFLLTVVYAFSTGPSLLLGPMDVRLRLALILAVLPALAVRLTMTALDPG